MLLNREYRIGIVLSGGAARGFAHLGVLKALNELNLKPGIISGVSAGAIAGAFYADGYQPEEITEMLSGRKITEYFRFTVPRYGLFKASGLIELIRKNLRAETFDELKIPLIVTVTNLNKGMPEYITSGNLTDAIIASSSIPVAMEMKMMNAMQYVDGGIMDNMPVNPLLNRCKKLIGVHVNPVRTVESIRGVKLIAERVFHLMAARDVNEKKKLFDIFIEPEDLKDYGFLDVGRAKEMVTIGYEATMKMLEKQTKHRSGS